MSNLLPLLGISRGSRRPYQRTYWTTERTSRYQKDSRSAFQRAGIRKSSIAIIAVSSSGGTAQSASGSRSDIVWADFIIAYSALEYCPRNVPLSKRSVADYTEQMEGRSA